MTKRTRRNTSSRSTVTVAKMMTTKRMHHNKTLATLVMTMMVAVVIFASKKKNFISVGDASNTSSRTTSRKSSSSSSHQKRQQQQQQQQEEAATMKNQRQQQQHAEYYDQYQDELPDQLNEWIKRLEQKRGIVWNRSKDIYDNDNSYNNDNDDSDKMIIVSSPNTRGGGCNSSSSNNNNSSNDVVASMNIDESPNSLTSTTTKTTILTNQDERLLNGYNADSIFNQNDLCFNSPQWCSFFGTDAPSLPSVFECGTLFTYETRSYCPPQFEATTPDLVCFRPGKYCRDAFGCTEMEEKGLFPECCDVCKSTIMSCCVGWCQSCISIDLRINLYRYFGWFVGNDEDIVGIGVVPNPPPNGINDDDEPDQSNDLPVWVPQIGTQFNQFRSSLCPPLSFNFRCNDLRSTVIFCWSGISLGEGNDINEYILEPDLNNRIFEQFNNCVNVVHNQTFFCPCISSEGNFGLQPIVNVDENNLT